MDTQNIGGYVIWEYCVEIGGYMAATSIPSDRKSARVALVQEHVRLENEHHLEGVLSTFGENAQYQDEAWGDRYTGHDGVRLYYEQLMAALPDLEIRILQEHV